MHNKIPLSMQLYGVMIVVFDLSTSTLWRNLIYLLEDASHPLMK